MIITIFALMVVRLSFFKGNILHKEYAEGSRFSEHYGLVVPLVILSLVPAVNFIVALMLLISNDLFSKDIKQYTKKVVEVGSIDYWTVEKILTWMFSLTVVEVLLQGTWAYWAPSVLLIAVLVDSTLFLYTSQDPDVVSLKSFVKGSFGALAVETFLITLGVSSIIVLDLYSSLLLTTSDMPIFLVLLVQILAVLLLVLFGSLVSLSDKKDA